MITRVDAPCRYFAMARYRGYDDADTIRFYTILRCALFFFFAIDAPRHVLPLIAVFHG